ncbi:MAG: aminotransferase class IV [Rhodospirillaceae bacterium]|nr:aminotransferase class IV [Rhodospirillaceae bacterium]
MVPVKVACIASNDRGFLLGDGLFETLRVQSGQVVALDRHLARLAEGLEVLGFGVLPLDPVQAIAATLVANQVINGMVRLTVSRGGGIRGVLPPETPSLTVLVTAATVVPVTTPQRVMVSRRTRRNEMSPLSRLKTLNYLDSILARQEAVAAGMDDAIVLNTKGRVAETTSANLLLRLDGGWVTPPVADGALPGTARARLLAAGCIVERSLSEEDLGGISAAFSVSALSLRPLVSLNGKVLSLPDADSTRTFRSVLDLPDPQGVGRVPL